MPPDTHPRLLGDIGGTHARFAWQPRPGAPLEALATLRCAEHASLTDAMAQYLATSGLPSPQACALGIANPVTGDEVRMTNHDWHFSVRALQQTLKLTRLLVINDFEALALALPTLTDADLEAVGGGRPDPASVCAVIGPGTGLGVAGLLPDGVRAVTGEGGHVTLAAHDDHEAAVVAWLRHRFGHASAERAVSGPGLVNLYEAVSALSGSPAEALKPPDVVDRALAGSDPACVQAIDLFCSFLGSVAGNLALTLGARGGVYIGGGMVPRLGAAFAMSRFRARFEAKGRFAEYLAAIPTWVIRTDQSPALAGAGRALDLSR
jgi:glucokinase